MFDEQPDGDPHGECAAEIRRLKEENKILREALTGARTVFDRLRTSKETQFSHAMARDGAMVHVHATVAAIDAALTPNGEVQRDARHGGSAGT